MRVWHLPEKKQRPEELSREEMEYAVVPQNSKRGRVEFDFVSSA